MSSRETLVVGGLEASGSYLRSVGKWRDGGRARWLDSGQLAPHQRAELSRARARGNATTSAPSSGHARGMCVCDLRPLRRLPPPPA
uniref:Uncharacterized protein n=1 Tax=Peronospora matthiolae TaxID=2874970 RepID=A0AAV1T6W8_9STRA